VETTRGTTGDSCNEGERKPKVLLPFGAHDLAQACPSSCPRHCPHADDSETDGASDSLGPPLSINEVANLIGVSAWTVRHRYLAAGLPHLRVGYSGKLIFYTNQIVRWLLWQQQKGGTNL
jgi:hypothetical protein